MSSNCSPPPHTIAPSEPEDLESLRRQLYFFQTILDELPNAIFVKNAEARFCFFNKAYETFFNIQRQDLLNRTVLDLNYLPLQERERYQREDLKAIDTGTVFHYEKSYETSQGQRQTLYWSKGCEVKSTGDKGLVGVIVDISEQKRIERLLTEKLRKIEELRKDLYHLSRIDALTDLYNRRSFEEQLAHHMSLAARHEEHNLSLLLLDLDFFKNINDTYGHDQGDKVLKQFAEILRSSCRAEDLASRIGGEEFALILPLTSSREARALAQRIGQSVRQRVLLPDDRQVTVSIGLAEYLADDSLETIFKRADQALYQAKREGRDRVCG